MCAPTVFLPTASKAVMSTVPSYPRVALWAGLEPAKTWVKAMCLYQFDYHRMSENLTLYVRYLSRLSYLYIQ